MPDYTAVFLPGLTMTMTAAGTLTGGDPVEIAGPSAVQKTTAGPSALGSAKCIGVASHDAVAGAKVTIIVDRVVHEGLADGVVTAGDQVMSSSLAGRQVKTVPASSGSPSKADVDQARVIIGIAITTASDGATVRWMQKLLPVPEPAAPMTAGSRMTRYAP